MSDRIEREWVEEPAADLLRVLFNYKYLTNDNVKELRDGASNEAVLTVRMAECLSRLNPWLEHQGVQKAIAAVTRISALDLLEANEKAYIALTYGVTAPFTDGAGKKQDRTVRFFDFDTIAANSFEFGRQVPIKGPRQDIIPDLIVYVNGLPLAVIECKSPALADPMGEAIQQFRRYESRDEFGGLGAPRLFETAQLSIALARDVAKFGTTTTPARMWAEWKDPFPLTHETLAAQLGRSSTPQDVLLAGLLAPTNLLDILRNFTVFETIEGKRIKKLARYQQFVAVGKAVERVRHALEPQRRGGVIHHTQGSGKSLTMVFLATKLRRLPEAENPTLVIVTDRTDLDDQISEQFKRSGFPNPIQAESGSHLRRLLSSGAGTTVMTTVHKFQTAVPSRSSVISPAKNIFVMVDEAHRTQYGALAARMRAGLPNACMFAFTGTPIDKTDRKTLVIFGDYIHRYLIDQSVADGSTVPIFYEMRDVKLRVDGRDIEKAVREAIPDMTDEQFEKLKKDGKLRDALVGADVRINAIAKDILDHFKAAVEPNNFKAQIVALSREVAVSYVEAIRELGGPECAVIMSSTNDDSAKLKRHHRSKREKDKLISRFKKVDDPLKIIVVCDMLLTGFDAPVEQVLYLDAPLLEHTLLQAIARVNRTAEGKTYGLVVDYWGDNKRIAKALDMFSEDDGVQNALKHMTEKIQLLESRHRAAIRLFEGVDRKDEEACIKLLELDDVRAKFELDFRRFAEAIDMVLPDPRALDPPYMSDLKWLTWVRAVARRRYRDDRFNTKDYGAKVGEIIAQHLNAEGVEQILAPRDILDPAFKLHLSQLSSDAAKAAEMEHAIRQEIHVRLEEDPVAYQSLWQRLENIISTQRENRIVAADEMSRYVDQLQSMAEEAIKLRGNSGDTSGLSGFGSAIFRLFDDSEKVVGEERKHLANSLSQSLEEYSKVIDWVHKEDVQRQMRRAIKDQLRSAGIETKNIEPITTKLMSIARARLAK
jgi:type I restriction enzyme, R subunit